MNSCLYVGRVQHGRRAPFRHDFSYEMALLLLDLDELDEVFARSWLWGVERRRPAAFWREDHFGDRSEPLAQAVRSRVFAQLGRHVRGAIRVLTLPRYFGLAFNPASFYFCFDEHSSLDAVVVEVTNTPWLERHTYVLDARGQGDGPAARYRHAKEFHVSPFMGMDADYEWVIEPPTEQLRLSVRSVDQSGVIFGAGVDLRREEISTAALRRALLRFPMQSLGVLTKIYGQALRLRWKGARFHPHPGRVAPGGDGAGGLSSSPLEGGRTGS